MSASNILHVFFKNLMSNVFPADFISFNFLQHFFENRTYFETFCSNSSIVETSFQGSQNKTSTKTFLVKIRIC